VKKNTVKSRGRRFGRTSRKRRLC